MKIVVLEDNADRQAAMQGCLLEHFPHHEHHFFDDARDLCHFFDANAAGIVVLSLDHDLEMKPTDTDALIDPGCGRDVVNHLIEQTRRCPVIVATTNTTAGDGMEFALREAAWTITRVYPWGDLEWIPSQWLRAVCKAIARAG